MDAAGIASWLQLGFAAVVALILLMKTIPRMEERQDARIEKREAAAYASAEKRDAAFIAAIASADEAFLAALDKQTAHAREQHLEHKEEIEESRTWASAEIRSLRESIERRNTRDRNNNGGGSGTDS